MARRAVLTCAFAVMVGALQKESLGNPFGFLKSNSQSADEAAYKVDKLKRAKPTKTAAKHVDHHDVHQDVEHTDTVHIDKHAKTKDEVTDRKQELTKRVAETGHDSGVHAEQGQLGAPCEGDASTCKTMCRWLKMSNKETNGGCQLFEWQLRSCNYTAMAERPPESLPEPIDCAVNYLRTTVLADEVPGYITAIDTCVNGLPPKVNETCYVALGLLRGEVHDWKAENELRADANMLGQDLIAAAEQGTTALASKKKEQEAIDSLTAVLAKAEDLPGHYLVDEVAKARRILDRLGPIPAVRKELMAAMADSERAFTTTELFKVKEAYVWLGVAVHKAEKYDIGPPLPEAQEMLVRVGKLKDALLDLKVALFAANVSVSTKSSVHATRLALDSAIKRAHTAGLTNEMPIAHDLLHRLEAFEFSIQNVSRADEAGREILEVAGNKGIQSLDTSIKDLNSTVGLAQRLGLTDNETVGAAVGSLDNLLYIRHARQALNKAVEDGRRVLQFNGAKLSDDPEEVAIDTLHPAAEWAEEVGLVNGIGVADSTIHLLRLVEEAKENMTLALQIGNHSLEARSGVADAIDALESAITGSMAVNVSAGVPLAQRDLKLLRALSGAREACIEAAEAANSSLAQRSGYQAAMVALNRSGHMAAKVDLTPEADIAAEQLKMLGAFADADRALTAAVATMAPARLPPVPKPLNDTRPVTKFKRKGLKPEDLPEVPGAADDADRDFREHERALDAAIMAAKRRGLVDPKMKAELALERAKQSSFEMLQAASAVAAESLEKKTQIDTAITTISSAIEEAKEMQMYIGLPEAEAQLAQLLIIQPARDELMAAMLQANVSLHTVSGMDAAIVRLGAAMDLNKELSMFAQIPKSVKLNEELLFVKNVYVELKAAIMQGQIAMKNEEGEEAAITELNRAIERADGINLHKAVKTATDVLHQLVHLNALHQQMQASMRG